MTVREFFATLYASKKPDDYVVVTALGEGRPSVRFFTEFTDKFFEHLVERDGAGANVYYGVGVLAQIPRFGRGKKEDIAAIPGLWLDIDIEGGVHRKEKLFRTTEEAIEVINQMGLLPSITVRTGGGLHLYFLFTELWRFTSPEEQEKADRVSQGFQTAVLRESRLKGATIDMTGDITRILRCPDTLNKKNRLPCEVIAESPARYTPEQFFKFEDEYPIKIGTARNAKTATVISSKETGSGESPPFEMILMSDPDLRNAHNRIDSDAHDSPSEYDLSFASKLAWMGLPPEQVAAGVLSSRTIVDSKAAKRPDYVARTVARSFVGVHLEKKGARQEEETEFEHKIPQELTGDERVKLLEEISRRFGVKIVNIVEYTGTRHSYEIVTEHGKFDLGTSDTIMNWRQFNSAMIQNEHATIPLMKGERWQTTLNLMLQAVEMRDSGGSADEEVWLRQYVFEYCRTAREYPHQGSMEYPKIDTEPKVWVKGDHRYVHATSFKQWLKHETRNEDKVSTSRFAAKMRGLGCLPHRLSCRIGDKHSGFDAWLIPRNIWDQGGTEDVDSDEPASSHLTNGLGKQAEASGEGAEPAEDIPGEEQGPEEGTDDDTPF